MSGDKEAQRLEALLTHARIMELRERPVEGAFDADHLREINRRIFQDLPDLGFTAVRPGAFREPVASANRDWIKQRDMEGLPPTTVAYSRMDAAALARLERTLERADPDALARLDTAAFTNKIANLYAQLDYIHPFDDGNSRTLREFTKQLANEAGFDIDWSRFDRSEAGRNVLYIARDLSVNEIAWPDLKGEDTRREVRFMLDQFGGNRTLPELLPDAVSKIDAAEITARLTEAAEDALDEKVSRVTDGADPETIRKVADVLRRLDAEHDHAEAAEIRSADHRSREDGDDHGL